LLRKEEQEEQEEQEGHIERRLYQLPFGHLERQKGGEKEREKKQGRREKGEERGKRKEEKRGPHSRF